MSTTATSGRCIATWRSRSSAFPDCATTSKPASSSSRAIPSRSSTESSASTTRTGVAPGPGAQAAGSCRRGPAPRAGRSAPARAGPGATRARGRAARARVRARRRGLGGDDLAAVAGRWRSGTRGGRRRRRSRPRRARRCRCAGRSACARASGQLWPPSRRCASVAAPRPASVATKTAKSSSPRQSTSWPAASRRPRARAGGCPRGLSATRRRARARAASTPRRRRRGR